MLTLKNITINSKTAEADYFPEAEVEASHIVVDLENAEIMAPSRCVVVCYFNYNR